MTIPSQGGCAVAGIGGFIGESSKQGGGAHGKRLREPFSTVNVNWGGSCLKIAAPSGPQVERHLFKDRPTKESLVRGGEGEKVKKKICGQGETLVDVKRKA